MITVIGSTKTIQRILVNIEAYNVIQSFFSRLNNVLANDVSKKTLYPDVSLLFFCFGKGHCLFILIKMMFILRFWNYFWYLLCINFTLSVPIRKSIPSLILNMAWQALNVYFSSKLRFERKLYYCGPGLLIRETKTRDKLLTRSRYQISA